MDASHSPSVAFFSRICRFCTRPSDHNGPAISLLSDRNEATTNLVRNYLGELTVRPGDGLPTSVCASCASHLEIWDRFRTLCFESVQTLQFLLDSNVGPQTDIDNAPVATPMTSSFEFIEVPSLENGSGIEMPVNGWFDSTDDTLDVNVTVKTEMVEFDEMNDGHIDDNSAQITSRDIDNDTYVDDRLIIKKGQLEDVDSYDILYNNNLNKTTTKSALFENSSECELEHKRSKWTEYKRRYRQRKRDREFKEWCASHGKVAHTLNDEPDKELFVLFQAHLRESRRNKRLATFANKANKY